MESLKEQLLTAWWTNQRVTLKLIGGISDEGMLCTLSTRGGRNVVRQLTHVHNVRIYQLDNRRAKELAAPLVKFDGKEEPERERLIEQLEASAEAIATFLADCVDGTGDRRCFKKGAASFLGYLIAHESHHRGNILLTLKQCGHNPDKSTRYGIWDWDRV